MQLQDRIKEWANILGFSGVGFSKIEKLENEARKLESWLNKDMHGTMSYMDNHFDLRIDPSGLLPGAKTLISLSFNYFPDKEDLSTNEFKIARYAYGKDYHKILRKKLKRLVSQMKEEVGDFSARVFVDSAPIMERVWAEKAGLGWNGKNTLLINPKQGSYFFLAEIICDLDFVESQKAIKDHCGTCTKCIDACPTDAIDKSGYILDASKCISYLTIERKDEIPDEFVDKMNGWIFGCDICQEVCPWNRFSSSHSEESFYPNERLKALEKRDWLEITNEVFDLIFEGSAVRRTKIEGLKRNIAFAERQIKSTIRGNS